MAPTTVIPEFADEAVFRALFDAVPDALLIANDERRYVDANPAACELLGLPRETILQMHIEDFAEASLRRAVQEQWQAFLDAGAQEGEYVLVRPDGHQRVVEFRARARFARGRHLSILRDVTERRERDRMLEQRSLLEAVITHAPVGLALLRGADLVYELVNPAWRRVFADLDFEGRRAGEVMPGFSGKAELAQKALFDGRPHHGVDILLPAEATRRPAVYADCWAVPLRDVRGTIDRVLMMAVDTSDRVAQQHRLEALAEERAQLVEKVRSELTERLRTEEQLREAQKNEALGRIAAGVTHDVNNILTVVLGCTDAALDGVGPDDPLRELLNEIRVAGERGAALTRRLLAFSRRQPISPRPTDLGAAVRSIAPLVRRLVGEGIRTTFVSEPSLPSVLIDPTQLEQVVLNLAANARDAMPRGGVFEVHVGTTEVAAGTDPAPAVPPGRYVALTVSDTGEGMTEEVRRHLFEPFFTTKRPGAGTGLGLAVVFGVVKQNGGAIEVESAPDRGTRFRILFPVAAPQEPDASAGGTPMATPDAAGAETVLVVEDEEAVRRLTVRMLKKLGYDVREAPDAATALRILEADARQIHLLASDVIMPEMDGIDLAHKVRAHWPWIPILLMSGYTDFSPEASERTMPPCTFVQKPFTRALLASKVREALDHARDADGRERPAHDAPGARRGA